MSFWNLSDGEDISTTGKSFESGGSYELIPHGTSAVAFVDEAKWAEDREGNRHISLRWCIAAPADLNNRKVFQKLWVADAKPMASDPVKARDKAKRMLAAIDANAGGKLFASGKEPTDDSLSMCLSNKPMSIKVNVWEIKVPVTKENPTGIVRGNNIVAVGPKPAAKKAAPVVSHDDEDTPF
jgi:hypothetical protein